MARGRHIFTVSLLVVPINGTANAKDKAAVKKIQGKLAVPVTGLYGRQTANRVRLWQAKRLMPPTGRVGRREWVRLGL